MKYLATLKDLLVATLDMQAAQISVSAEDGTIQTAASYDALEQNFSITYTAALVILAYDRDVTDVLYAVNLFMKQYQPHHGGGDQIKFETVFLGGGNHNIFIDARVTEVFKVTHDPTGKHVTSLPPRETKLYDPGTVTIISNHAPGSNTDQDIQLT